MVKKRRLRRHFRINAAPFALGERIYDLLRAMGGSRQKAALGSLWRNWEQAVGLENAGLARPLGYRDHTLLLVAEDAFQMQETHLRLPDILAAIHAFLGFEYFTEARINLECLAKKPGRHKRARKKQANQT